MSSLSKLRGLIDANHLNEQARADIRAPLFYYEGGKQVNPKIEEAIKTILSGVCKRVDIDGITKVYLVKNVIRIDIKLSEEEAKRLEQ